MNSELVENRVSKIMEIYFNNGGGVPNPFKMKYILKLNPKMRRFGEFVNDYKRLSLMFNMFKSDPLHTLMLNTV